MGIKYEISLAQSALDDVRAMLDWYVEQNAEGAGRRLAGRIFERIEALADHPRMGRIVPEFDEDSLRELIEPPFRIVYRVASSCSVTIIRVWRSERMLHLPSEHD